MSLMPEDHMKHLSNIKKDFNRFFHDMLYAFDQKFTFEGHQIDIHETDDEVIASCRLPGIENKEDIDIHIENNTLYISGSVNRTDELKTKDDYRREQYMGHFQRTILLPCPVQEDRVKATYKNDILQIKMPKLKKDNKKKIDIDFN